MQQVMTSYFVIYLTSLGYPLVSAGYIFSSAVAVAVPGRILWGWLGSFYVSPRIVLAGLALGIAASAVAVGCFNSGWSLAAIGIAAGVMSASAMSWHGILLSETARLAPSNAVGPVSAVVLSCGQCGALIGPLVYAALLSLTGSYGIGFVVCAIPSLLVGIGLLRQKSV